MGGYLSGDTMDNKIRTEIEEAGEKDSISIRERMRMTIHHIVTQIEKFKNNKLDYIYCNQLDCINTLFFYLNSYLSHYIYFRISSGSSK